MKNKNNKKPWITSIVIGLAMALGIYTAFPVQLTKSFWNPTNEAGKAYILDAKYPSPITQIKQNQVYVKNNDEAVVFWVGGPKLGNNWDADITSYAFMFGKAPNSQDLAKNPVKGNYNINYDVYAGVQTQWEGIRGTQYFQPQFRASNSSGFVNKQIERPMTIGDVVYREKGMNVAEIATTTIAEGMMKDTSENMYEVAKDLKAKGYTKVHYIAHSFGTFMTYDYITRYGDDAFEYVDSIRTVSTRLDFNKKLLPKIDGTFFPYFGYNAKADDYSTLLKVEVTQNAISSRLLVPIFYWVTSKDFITPLKNLSQDNKDKLKIIATDFDLRVGSMQPNELELRDYGIDIEIVPTETIGKYVETYLLQKPFNFPDKPQTSVRQKDGINNHDNLLRWFLDNAIGKGPGTDWTSKEPLRISNSTYWCSLKGLSANPELDTICQD